MLQANASRVAALTHKAFRVLDAGAGDYPFPSATHVIDVRNLLPAADPRPVVVHDLCETPWPFPDKFFDYSICCHTLEDIRDPLTACRELMRVSKAGYIETPSRLRESFHYKRGYLLRRIVGRPIRVGFGHHRWFCEPDGSGIVFLSKPHTMMYSSRHFITRGELRRDLTAEESVFGLFWEGTFSVSERLLITPGGVEADLERFKREALATLL